MLGAALAVAVLSACSETSLPQASGKGTINALNAMPGSPGINFLIEERFLGTLGYKGSLGAQPFDDLSYTFNFEFTFPGDATPTRIASHFLDMMVDTDYVLVLTGTVAMPVVTQWERPEREWSDTDTAFDMTFAHLSPALGDVDVYFGPTGTAPVLGEERAKLAFGDDRPDPIDLETGEYELILTGRDDPATILYQSYPTTFSPRQSYTIAVFDADASITGNISVRWFSNDGFAAELPDTNFLPTLRTVHAAFGTENIDIYRDDDFTAPVFSDLGFGQSTGDLPVPDGAVNYTYTAVGNPGTIIHEQNQLVPRGQPVSTYLIGAPGELSRILLADSRQSIQTHPKLRVVVTTTNFELLDLYLVDTGTDIADANPSLVNVGLGFNTNFVAQIAGSYDLILTLQDEKDPIATVSPLDLAAGDVVEALVLDNVDPAIADIVITRF